MHEAAWHSSLLPCQKHRSKQQPHRSVVQALRITCASLRMGRLAISPELNKPCWNNGCSSAGCKKSYPQHSLFLGKTVVYTPARVHVCWDQSILGCCGPGKPVLPQVEGVVPTARQCQLAVSLQQLKQLIHKGQCNKTAIVLPSMQGRAEQGREGQGRAEQHNTVQHSTGHHCI